jgi:hypothetical protein
LQLFRCTEEVIYITSVPWFTEGLAKSIDGGYQFQNAPGKREPARLTAEDLRNVQDRHLTDATCCERLVDVTVLRRELN